MATFVVAAVVPALSPSPGQVEIVKIVQQLFIVDATNDQAAINLVASWGSAPADADYLALPFNPKRATGGGGG